MAERLPPLVALRAFEAAARHEHFGRAGDELHVTHSAVSRQVRALEDDLGVQLFERRNRAVFLTEAGRRLLETTRSALRQIAETAAELRAGLPAPLVVSCEPTLTQRWLIPRLPAFQAEHPGTVVHVLAAGGPINLERDRVDCAIRRGDFTWPPDVFAEPLFEERVGPVCAPPLAEPGDREHLLRLPRIHSATRPDAWDRWAADQGVTLPPAPSRTFEHFYLSLEAATAGLGVAIGPEPLVVDAVRSGRLVAPCGFRPNGYRYVLLSRTSFAVDARKRRFLAWMRREAAQGA
ncbi:LysR substrate-binding domain-containing protein [Arenibaculum sp.]|jgi:DNA-binding transcriptional LysR family regulator|uniref:LysR substrate-binding domain-containing protein n=1 Tax=Arenibaculum sp. TaxID=2865862 RepID=UPI002E147E8F|nr:LysR substrate-binding domain-containing protein [Arenibaculum sp.]